MKKLLLELYKEAETSARIKDYYNQFLTGKFHKYMNKHFGEELQNIGE